MNALYWVLVGAFVLDCLVRCVSLGRDELVARTRGGEALILVCNVVMLIAILLVWK